MQLNAGFWRRFLSASIDWIVLALTITLLSLLFIDFQNLKFWHYSLFYLWILTIISVIFFIKIFLPYKTNGRTIGTFIFKTKIVFNDEKRKMNSMLARESVFAIVWIIMLFLIMVLINHTMIIKYLTNKWKTAEMLDQIRVNIVITFGSFSVFIQLLMVMTLIASSENISFYDKYSNTRVIVTNKTKPIPEPKKIFKPIKVEKQIIEWEE